MIPLQNFEHKHRTKVFVMNVTEELADWEDSRNMNRKRQWFTIEEALQQLALHKPVQRRYLQQLKNSRNLATSAEIASPQSTNSTSTVAMTQSPTTTRQQSSSNNTTTATSDLTNLLPTAPPASTNAIQLQSTTN